MAVASGASHKSLYRLNGRFAPTPVGCAELAGVPRDRTATLGTVALGRAPGRLQVNEITVYKAMGVAMEDHVAACLAYEGARALGVGSALAW